MRADMFEIIIERPRRTHPKRSGSWYPRGRVGHLFFRDDDASPKRLAMGFRYKEKGLNENLAPLMRFLRARVGRPWDKVRSEICATLACGSAVQKHVLDHVKDFVEESATLVDGRVHGSAFFRGGSVVPITEGRASFYVCPKTGLLRENTGRRRSWKKALPPRHETAAIDAGKELRRIHGVWWTIHFAKLPEDAEARARCFDVVLEEHLDARFFAHDRALERFYGRVDRYAALRTVPGKRELRCLRARPRRGI